MANQTTGHSWITDYCEFCGTYFGRTEDARRPCATIQAENLESAHKASQLPR